MNKPSIQFDPVEHRYWDAHTSEDYLSVTQLIKQHTPTFDEQAKSAKKALELGISQKEVLAMWADKRERAADRGIHLHEVINAWLVDGSCSSDHAPMLKEISGWIAFQKPTQTVHEYIVYHQQARLAGTMDLGLLFPEKDIRVGDYKTNEEGISTTSYGEYMLPPISSIPSCKWTHYVLQVSLYSYFWECMGYTPRKPVLLHIDQHLRVTPHTVPYWRDEARLLVDARIADLEREELPSQNQDNTAKAQ